MIMPMTSLKYLRRLYFQRKASLLLRQSAPTKRSLNSLDYEDLFPTLTIAVVGDTDYFLPYAQHLTLALKTLGVTAFCTESLDGVSAHVGNEMLNGIIVIGPHHHPMRLYKKRFKKVLLAAINTEQIPLFEHGGYAYGKKRLADFLIWAPHYDLIFEWSRLTAIRLREFGFPVRHCVHGGFDFHEPKESENKKYDLLFLGSLGALKKRRKKIINELSKDFSSHPGTYGAWGYEKAKAYRESALVLNLHAENSTMFESPRFFEALSLGNMIVSEPVQDSFPFTPGVHYASSIVISLRKDLVTLLSKPDRIWKFRQSGYSRAREFSIEKVAEELLGAVVMRHYEING